MTHNIKQLLLSDTAVLRWLLGVSAFAFAFGWWFADSTGGAYDSMLRHAPAWAWGAAFFTYGCSKFVLRYTRPPKAVIYAVVILGVYLWLFTVLSFADNPHRKMGSADVMLVVMVLCEIWVGAAALSGGDE